MKVLFINTVYGRGSTGRIVAELGEKLVSEGDDFAVAYGRGKKVKGENVYFIGNKITYYWHALLSRFTDRAGFYSKFATKRLIKFIKKYNPDVIHLHNLHGYYLNIKILFDFIKDEFNGKVVWTLHDCWAFTGHCTHFSFIKCDKWKSGCFNCDGKKSYPSSIFKDNSKKNYLQKKEIFSNVKNMTIVTVSDWLKEEVNNSFLNQYEVVRVYNGIDCNKFAPVEENVKEKLKIQDKKMILLVSDGFDERKGFNTFLSVASIAPENWHFIIVGVNKEQIKILPKNATGFERIWNQKELIEFYSSADVFFNPSVEETFGLVTAEAMACNTPAVVMNSTACPELIVSNDAGEVVDLSAMPEEIITILSKNMLKKGNQKQYIERDFSIEKYLQGYLEIYKK
ncbi:MAG: glycosyltransferase [Clostridiales bacterium]|nr:glycosyltransferase [Clostridiales bacterium]